MHGILLIFFLLFKKKKKKRQHLSSIQKACLAKFDKPNEIYDLSQRTITRDLKGLKKGVLFPNRCFLSENMQYPLLEAERWDVTT